MRDSVANPEHLMSHGSKIAALAVALVVVVLVVYFTAVGPKSPTATKPAVANATDTVAPVAPANPFNSNGLANGAATGANPPTLTLTPGSTGATTGNGFGANATPSPANGVAANARSNQPGFAAGSLGAAGTGKGDLPANGAVPGAAGTKDLAFGSSASTAATGASNAASNSGAAQGMNSGTNSGIAGSSRLVNGFPAPATGSNAGASGAFPSAAPGGPSPIATSATSPSANTATNAGSAGFGGATSTRSADAGSERLHVVASGETMGAIARKYLGSEAKWEAIAKANPAVDPKSMKIGTKLRIPAQAAPSAETSGALAANAGKPAPATATASAAAASTGPGGVHVVAEGDTLSSIAARHYGSSKFWQKIAEANPSINPNNLRIGQKVKLPAKTAVVGGENVER